MIRQLSTLLPLPTKKRRTERLKPMTYILYNPLAGNGRGLERAHEAERRQGWRDATYLDITGMDAAAFLEMLPSGDRVMLAGGDGTLNHFVNGLNGRLPRQPIWYYPAGSGNDFMNDVGEKAQDGLVELKPYLENLPVVEINGQQRFFINGVGYGIDGYCCEAGDRLRRAGKEQISYAGIAVKGLLFHYKPTCATVTVDGVERRYKHVWLAPTMNGRYYGGGMEVAPEQNRLNPQGTVTTVVLHCASKLKTLAVFPSIFKGEHVKHREMVDVLTGHEMTVRFDRPTALQIDGETVCGVTEYRVLSAAAQLQAEPVAV